MKILGIDSSGLVATIAVSENGQIKAEYTVNNKKTHSTTLLPMLSEISKMLEDDLSDVDAIAVSAGPGSFTGLRIGSATAKGLAEAWSKPIVSVPTVDALAMNMWGYNGVVCPLMDARRNQTYTGIYEFVMDGCEMRLEVIQEQCAVPLEEILNKVNELGKNVVFLGDGVPVFEEQIKATLKVPYTLAPASLNRQRAASVCVLGEQLYAQGKLDTAEGHGPEYLRMSQAERERMEQENANS